MKSVLLFSLAVFASSAFAEVTAPPYVVAFCGLKFIGVNQDPQSVEVGTESVEGSDDVDYGQVELELVSNQNGVYRYASKQQVLFSSGAPSYKAVLNFSVDTKTYVPPTENWGGYFTDATVAYRFNSNSGKSAGEGSIRGEKTMVDYSETSGDLVWIHHPLGKNGSFRTASRQGVFNCELSYSVPIQR